MAERSGFSFTQGGSPTVKYLRLSNHSEREEQSITVRCFRHMPLKLSSVWQTKGSCDLYCDPSRLAYVHQISDFSSTTLSCGPPIFLLAWQNNYIVARQSAPVPSHRLIVSYAPVSLFWLRNRYGWDYVMDHVKGEAYTPAF